ncbi:MAG: RNA 2',3'-cyclic phosphodiesterase [Bauldia sp.]|nr:RNA 2',3'-cyclic phosphodiesterase [Bauldia sp.]
MPRLFTGVEIPAEIADRLSYLRGGLAGARWIDQENYHLTLRFIGDIDMVAAEAVAEGLSRVRRSPFPLRINGVGALGTRKPKAVVAEIEPSPPLMGLQAEHQRIMQRIGLQPEGRKFTPHVTIARIRNGGARDIANYLTVRGGFSAGPFLVDRFVLFSSRNSIGGGPYVVEEAYDLWPRDRAARAAAGA